MSEIQILAAIKVKQADRDALLPVMKKLVDESRKEAGCLRYDFVEELADPLSFCVVETWTSQAALDAHCATPHFAELIRFFDPREVELNTRSFKQIF